MGDVLAWSGNWAWSLPLIVVTVMYHAAGLALNGMILFGLTTAFLFAMLREFWPSPDGVQRSMDRVE